MERITMFDLSKDIQSMTAFRRKPAQFVKRLKTTKRPVILTINGKAEAVIQDTESYQRLLDIAAQSDVYEAIRQGLEDVSHGRTRPAREVFLEMRRKYGIRR
jgi:prevent-host-death family protein